MTGPRTSRYLTDNFVMTGDYELIAAHIVRALLEHRKWCRSRGHRFPPLLDAVLDALAATTGPERPAFGEMPDLVDSGPVPAPLLLNDIAAAKQLGVSARTVRRLRADGALPTVVARRRRLIRLTDLQTFVANGGTK